MPTPADRLRDRIRASGPIPFAAFMEEALYGEDSYQGLIVWRAPKPSGAMLAFMHGGGWTSGYKEWMAFMAPAFTEAGIDFASIGYRLAPQHVFPTALEDGRRGI